MSKNNFYYSTDKGKYIPIKTDLDIIHSNLANTAKESSNKIGYIYDTDLKDYTMTPMSKNIDVYYNKSPGIQRNKKNDYNVENLSIPSGIDWSLPNSIDSFSNKSTTPSDVDSNSENQNNSSNQYHKYSSASSDSLSKYLSPIHDSNNDQNQNQYSSSNNSSYNKPKPNHPNIFHEFTDQNRRDNSDTSDISTIDFKQLIDYSVNHLLNNIYEEVIHLYNIKKYLSKDRYQEILNKIQDVINHKY